MLKSLVDLINNAIKIFVNWVAKDEANKTVAYRGRNIERKLQQKQRIDATRKLRSKLKDLP